MADQKNDFTYEAAHEANSQFGNTEKGRSWLNDQEEGAGLLDNFEKTERLKEENIRDPLTGLYNRRHLDKRLSELTAEKTDGRFALVILDLDFFKLINDEHGHDFGDEALQIIARRLEKPVRFFHVEKGIKGTDEVCRYGGEEFAVICQKIDNAEDAYLIAERLRSSIGKEPFIDENGNKIKLTASAGVGVWDGPGEKDPKTLIKRVDSALYDAKIKRDCTVSAL